MNEKFVLDLSKTFELNLAKAGIVKIPVLRTRAAVDRSGSMHRNFELGFVQRVVDLFIAAALKFDDNGELEIGFYNTNFKETEVAVLSDAGKYMSTKGRAIKADGGTLFHPIIEWTQEEDTRGADDKPKGFLGLIKNAFSSAPAAEGLPDCGQYTGIVTDGRLESDSAMAAFEARLRTVDQKESFFQFIAIGNGVDSEYLNRIAGQYPNIAVMYLSNPMKFDDNTFYEELANPKFVKWVETYNARRGL